MLEGRRRLDLPLEPLDAEALRQLRREDLHHHLPLEPQPLGGEDARHAPAAEFVLEGVGAAQRGLELGAEVFAQDRGGLVWTRRTMLPRER